MSGNLDVIPLLLQEGIAGLLLVAFLATLGETLVFANRHIGVGIRSNSQRY